MEAVPVRELMRYNPKEIYNGLKGNITVQFEDGVVKPVKASELSLSRYFWDMITPYPQLMIRSEYLVSEYYDNGLFASKTCNRLFSTMFKDIVKTAIPINDTTFDHTAKLYKQAYVVDNAIYSEFSYMIEKFALSIRIEDFIELQFDDGLMERIRRVKDEPSAINVKEAYDYLDKMMMSDKYKDNPLRLSYICGLMKKNQINQVLGPRGYVTEMNSRVFKQPIANSFTLGMGNLYELAADSRSGAKALFMSDVGISHSEYFARGLQLVTMVIEGLEFGDCGSTDYRDWYVKPKDNDDGSAYPGDFDRLIGKYFYDDDRDELRPITIHDTHVIGKTIKLRTADKCRLKNKKHVCSTCFGEISYSIHQHTNLGHICTAELTSSASQGILSTKHLAASANTAAVVLDSIGNKYFTIKSRNHYVLKQNIVPKGHEIHMVISARELFGIKDINKNSDLKNLDPGRITKIEKIRILHGKSGALEQDTIIVKRDSSYGQFELRFLDYVRKVGYVVDEYDNFHIDISKWKSNMPFMKVPDVEFNFMDFNKEIQRYFTTNINERGYIDTPDSFIPKLFTLINRKMNINIAILEVIVYAFTVYDRETGNFDLSRGSNNPTMGKLAELVSKRSASAAIAYEDIFDEMVNPSLFFSQYRPNHILDVMLMPNEAIESYRKRRAIGQ